MARIVVELEIEGDAQDAYDVVNAALDAGFLQDEIEGARELTVKRATVRLDDDVPVATAIAGEQSLVLHAQGQGDRTVGDGALQATIEIHNMVADPAFVEAARQSLEDAFRQIFDDARAKVLTAAQLEQLEQDEAAETDNDDDVCPSCGCVRPQDGQCACSGGLIGGYPS